MKSLCNKYRPDKFSELVLTEEKRSFLISLLNHRSLPHCLIIHGDYGCGKTSIARLLAKGVNCEQFQDELCGRCVSCIGSPYIEYDIATMGSISNIREMMDQCAYPPLLNKFRVFILDECHQMSKAAFQVMLKTIEEEDCYNKFIFVTTELRQIPDTVLSRSVVFKIERPDNFTLAKKIFDVARLENIEVNKEQCEGIASAYDGHVRDCFKFLELVKEGVVEPEGVYRYVGVVTISFWESFWNNLKHHMADWDSLCEAWGDEGWELSVRNLSQVLMKDWNNTKDVRVLKCWKILLEMIGYHIKNGFSKYVYHVILCWVNLALLELK